MQSFRLIFFNKLSKHYFSNGTKRVLESQSTRLIYINDIDDYLLNPKDVTNLPKYYSRSPFSHNKQLRVFLRSDIEAVAHKKYGGEENFKKTQKFANFISKRHKLKLFKMFFPESNYLDLFITKYEASHVPENIFDYGSGKLVVSTLIVNLASFITKFGYAQYTGSSSIFCEAVHSLADTFNEIVAFYGLKATLQKPDADHPYGYRSMEHITSLISGVGVFCIGLGLTSYHTYNAFTLALPVTNIDFIMPVFAVCYLFEIFKLSMTMKQAYQEAKKEKVSLYNYFVTEMDPSLNSLLFENLMSMTGLQIALFSTLLSFHTQSYLPDAIGSLIVTSLIGSVAVWNVRSNIGLLLGKSIPEHRLEAIQNIIDKESIIKGIHDIKATHFGDDAVFKAEIDINYDKLTKKYIDTIPLQEVLHEFRRIKTEEQLNLFMLKYGENLVKIVGDEINEVEHKIKKRSPYVKHIDIEIN